jgi:hypothetical protein
VYTGLSIITTALYAQVRAKEIHIYIVAEGKDIEEKARGKCS